MSSIKKHMLLTGLLITLTASTFAALPAYADTASTATQSVTQTDTAQVFTIDKAIQYAKENSKSLASYKAAEEYQKYLRSDARITFKSTRDYANKVGISDINTSLVANGYMYRASQLNYRVAQRSTILNEYTLECNVTQAFYTYLSSVQKEKFAEENLTLAKNNASYAQIKYNGGTISEIDLISFQNSELEAQYDLNQATRTKEENMLKLKSVLNYPLDQELIVTGEFTRHPMSDVAPDTAIERAKNSITRVNADETYSLAKEKLDRYHRYYTSNQAGYHSATAEFANAELTYQNTLEQEQINIYTSYNSMLTCYENLNLMDSTLASMEKMLAANKLNYDMGIITADSYLENIKTFNETKNSLVDAELLSYISVVNYELLFDCENTVFEEDDPLL